MKIKEAPFAGFGCDRWRYFMFYWYAVYAVDEASSLTNEIKVGPSTIVLRTRPDVPFSSYFDLRRASQYFQKGHRGQHLVFGMEYGHAQSDIVMFTSWGAYESDIAKPLHVNLSCVVNKARPGLACPVPATLGCLNGQGYGMSISGYEIAQKAVDGMPNRSRAMTVVESYYFPIDDILRRAPENGRLPSISGTAFDLAKGVHIYCATRPSSIKTERTFKEWLPKRKQIRSVGTFDLDPVDGAAPMWPLGC